MTTSGPDCTTEGAATVFVVDDDAAVRYSLRELMTAVALPVETFASGREFLDAFDPTRPGCLVLDLRLREGSGLDVQDELCRRQVNLPIIVLTGHGNVPDAVRAMKAGAFDFLQKPPQPTVLLERIRAAIESDRATRAAASGPAEVPEPLSPLTPREHEVIREVASDLAVSMRALEGNQGRMR